MKIEKSFLLALVNCCFAARYSIDASCRSDNSLFNGVKGALQEGIHLADNALTVMTNHQDDALVQKMAKYVLGTDDFDNKFARAKGTFAAVKAYEKEPSQFQPQDDAWRSARSNADVEIYCGGSRFTLPEGSRYWIDTTTNELLISRKSVDKCYTTVLESSAGAPKALTKSSDFYDRRSWAAAFDIDTSTRRFNYLTARPGIVCTMDICTWFTTQANNDGWPTINAQRVEMCKTDEFRAGLSVKLTPMDGLKTIGSTMLHELTHTHQGGQLEDIIFTPPGVDNCYGWICVGGLKSEWNADSIALLGIAMKLWSLNHYAEDDGTIHPFP